VLELALIGIFLLRLSTFSFNAFSADNLPQLNKEEFNKEAYLDLSKPYTYNWNNPQGYTKKDISPEANWP
jgi:hypothetical protein